MLTLLEWGHTRQELFEDINLFDDEDHMNHVGEFSFHVNETCLSGDHSTCLVAPNDRDSHSPFLIHITPSDMIRTEAAIYIPAEKKMARKERRKEIQKTNKRKAYESQSYGGYYGQYSSSSSSTWRPRNR